MNEEKYFENVVVASFDILGFKSKLEADSRIAGRILGNFIQNAVLGGSMYSEQVDFSKPGYEKMKVHDMYSKLERFSDSLFIYGNPEESINDQLGKIAGMAAKTIAVGLMCDRPYMVRCGIGVGDLVARTFDGFGERITYFTGKSILRAYQIECDQNWAGGALHEDLLENVSGEYFKQYALLPWKSPRTSNISINWVKMLLAGRNEKQFWKGKIEEAFGSTEPSVLVKQDNTIKYLFNVE